jgi:hypothetical protein
LTQEAVYLHELPDGVIKEWISFDKTERPHLVLDKGSQDAAFIDTERIHQAA